MSASRSLAELAPDIQEEIKLLAIRVTQGFPAFRSLRAVLTEKEWQEILPDSAATSRPRSLERMSHPRKPGDENRPQPETNRLARPTGQRRKAALSRNCVGRSTMQSKP